MKTTLPFSLMVLYCMTLNGQQLSIWSAGGKSTGLAQSNLYLQGVQAIFINPSGIAFSKEMGGMGSMERRFNMIDLEDFKLGWVQPLGLGALGISVQQFGFEAFQQQGVGITYARQLFNNFALGVRLNYLNIRVPFYGNHGTFIGEVGLQAEIRKGFWVNTSIYNPFSTGQNETAQMPTQLGLGLSYKINPKVMISAQGLQRSGNPIAFQVGLDYQVITVFSLQLGASTYPEQLSFGMGFNFKGLALNLGTLYHQTLGLSPSISFAYQFKR